MLNSNLLTVEDQILSRLFARDLDTTCDGEAIEINFRLVLDHDQASKPTHWSKSIDQDQARLLNYVIICANCFATNSDNGAVALHRCNRAGVIQESTYSSNFARKASFGSPPNPLSGRSLHRICGIEEHCVGRLRSRVF